MALPTKEAPEHWLIVGAGVFGASSALSLKRAKPWAKITIVDQAEFPNPAGASFDHNKIIRSDYRESFYTKLALEALNSWTNDSLYTPFYHEKGMLYAEDCGKGPNWLLNYIALGHETDAELMNVDEARHRFPWFKNANWSGVKKAYYNPKAGWGDAVPALRAVLKEAISLGVIYHRSTVKRILLDHDQTLSPRCVGIQTSQGPLLADHVLLCTGAATAKLLADSAPNDSNLQVAGRLAAAAALSCMVRVRSDLWEQYQDAPVFANLMPHTYGEAIPAWNGYIKLNHELSFTNLETHQLTGDVFSNPPANSELCTWTKDVPQSLRDEALKVLVNIYGRTDGLEPECYRLCWDAITPTQDWIISPHDACNNLYLATGGSFHAWKFLPILGDNIVSMLDGTLEADKKARWAWTRAPNISLGACDTYCPRRDLKDILVPDRVRARV